MAILDRIKFDSESNSVFAWKFPSEKLKLGSQLVVNQSQVAIFLAGGEVCDVFESGTHTISSGNIPILDKLINLPFGGDTPFTAEVWFVSKVVKRDLKWGTAKPIQLLDTSLGFPISVRAFGQWGVRIIDPILFLSSIVGSKSIQNDDEILSFFIGEIRENLTNVLSDVMASVDSGLFNIHKSLSKLSDTMQLTLRVKFLEYGIHLENLNIESINIPKEEMEKIQNVFEKKMEMQQLSSVAVGQGYTTSKSFEIMSDAANNTGASGNELSSLLGAGIGLGAGLPIGQQIGQAVSINSSSDDSVSKLRKLKALFEEGLISKEQFQKKQEDILGEL